MIMGGMGNKRMMVVVGLILQIFAFLGLLRGDYYYVGATTNTTAQRIRGSLADGDASDENAGSTRTRTRTRTRTSSTTTVGTVSAVYGLIDRVLKDPKAKDSIRLHIVEDEGDGDDEDEDEQLSLQQQQQQQEKNDDRRQWFRLEQQELTTQQLLADDENGLGSSSTSSAAIIVITATSASELTAGIGYYFKHYCNFTLEWSTGGRAGGSHIVLPEIWPVPLDDNDKHDDKKKTVIHHRTTKWRYVLIECIR